MSLGTRDLDSRQCSYWVILFSDIRSNPLIPLAPIARRRSPSRCRNGIRGLDHRGELFPGYEGFLVKKANLHYSAAAVKSLIFSRPAQTARPFCAQFAKFYHKDAFMRICTICDDHFPSYWTSTNQVVTTASHLGKLGVSVDFMIPTLAEHLLLKSEKKLRKICEFYGVETSFRLRVSSPCGPPTASAWKTHPRCGGARAGQFLGLRSRLQPQHPAGAHHAGPRRAAMFETYRLLPKEYPYTAPLFRKVAAHPRFLGITTHSELSRKSFIDAGVPAEKVIALHNGYDPREFEPELSKADARRLLGLPENDFTVVYTGHMTPMKGVEILVDIAKLAPELSFVLVGGPTEADVNRICRMRSSGRAKRARAGLGHPEQGAAVSVCRRRADHSSHEQAAARASPHGAAHQSIQLPGGGTPHRHPGFARHGRTAPRRR